MPMPEGFQNFPLYIQAGSVVAAAIIGGTIAFFGHTKKWLDKLPQPQKVGPTDAVVVSGAFADGRPLAELTAEVRKLNTGVSTLIEVTQNASTSSSNAHRSQTDAIDNLSSQIGRLVRAEMNKDE